MINRKKSGIFFINLILFNYFNLAFGNQDQAFNLEPIVITKSKTHLINTYSVESDRFENANFDSPFEAMNLLPLDLQSRSPKGGIQTDFSLRGSTFQGVLMLIDGQRINDPQTGHHNSDIPLTQEDIERIDVIPGVGSSVFGPDAVGGAINIILKKRKDKKRILELKGGQFETKSGLFSISDKMNNLGVRFSLENQESKGFQNDTDFKKFTTTLSSSLDIPDGEFGVNLGYQEKEFGAFDFYTPGLRYPSKEWTKTYLLNSSLNLIKGGFVIRPSFLWRRHYDKFMLDKTQLRSTYLNHHRTDIYTPSIYFQHQDSFLGRTGVGIEYGQEQIHSTNLGKHFRDHKSIFMDENKDLYDRLIVGLSYRWDEFDGFNYVNTGSVNFRYEVFDQNAIRFGVSNSMRIPSFTELYYNDPTTVGNAGLSAEHSLNYQVGYDYRKERIEAGFTVFWREEKDFIDWIKRSLNQQKWQVENITESENQGIESYLKLNINHYLELGSNYSYVNKHIDEQGFLYKYGANYFKHLINASLNFNLPFGIQNISTTYKKRPSRDGWFILNTYLSYNLFKKSSLFLKITNLLNTKYQEIVGIPQPGRWIEAGLKLEW